MTLGALLRRYGAAALLALWPSGRLAAWQCPNGAPPPCAGSARAPAPMSVAVLAFDNLSRDTADLYLVDGLAEELTSQLGAVQRLRVPGRSVVRRAQQAAEGDAMAVGRAVNVRYVVEGSLRRAGPRVRVSARLLRASDGVRVWGDDYDRTMNDLLTLQEDIARQVAASVTGQLLPGEQRALERRPTASAEAYDHYLRGRYLVTRRTSAAIEQAAAEFDAAVWLDPRFAAAEARRANALVVAFGYGVPLASPESLAARAARSARRAIDLDSLSSDGWLALGMVRFWFAPIDVEAGRNALERAIRLDPRSAEAQHTLGVVLSAMPEDSTASMAAFQRALAIEPTRAVTLLDMAQIRFMQRNFRETQLLVDSGLALDPNQARLWLMRSSLRLAQGEPAGARRDAETALRLAPPAIRPFCLTNLIGLDLRAGDTASAQARLADLAAAPIRPATAYALALSHFGLGDSAIAVLQRTMLPVDWTVLYMPDYDALRALPGFREAIEPLRPRRQRT